MKTLRGFTLIELLVVVAIIGVLAAVVLASLNSARAKGQEAAIKSSLKNMIAQAELSYSDAGNYSTTCAGLASIMQGITNMGGGVGCYSYYHAGFKELNSRWGVTAKNSGGTKNWSVDSSGVVVWDTANTGATMNWTAANAACEATGGRLPNMEQFIAIWQAYGNVTPTGFTADYYWSGTTAGYDSNVAYIVGMQHGGSSNYPKTSSFRVRCVR